MFKNKNVLITGGSSGIGEATALMFAHEGANVAITYKENKKGADNVVEKIKASGVKAFSVKADLTNDNEAKIVIDNVLNEFGNIDILVNNAGRYIDGDEWNGEVGIWQKSIQQNLVSVLSVSKYTIDGFQKQNSGIIVNIASVHGVDGKHDAISYGAAKAGVINATQAYAKLIAKFGRANSVCPVQTNAGYWLTCPKEELEEMLEKKPSHKLVEPDVIAKKVLFLASDEAKDINGQNFIVTD